MNTFTFILPLPKYISALSVNRRHILTRYGRPITNRTVLVWQDAVIVLCRQARPLGLELRHLLSIFYLCYNKPATRDMGKLLFCLKTKNALWAVTHRLDDGLPCSL